MFLVLMANKNSSKFPNLYRSSVTVLINPTTQLVLYNYLLINLGSMGNRRWLHKGNLRKPCWKAQMMNYNWACVSSVVTREHLQNHSLYLRLCVGPGVGQCFPKSDTQDSIRKCADDQALFDRYGFILKSMKKSNWHSKTFVLIYECLCLGWL